MAPSIIFGDIRGMEIEDVKPVLQKYGIERLDTAASYVGGESERRAGAANLAQEFVIDTKILSGALYSGTLSPEKIEESSKQSLERLQMQQVNVLYCHGPDYKTPLEDQARGFQDVYQKGRFKELGVSNFMPGTVESWLRISEKNGYVKPTWYQGQYNLLCRTPEEILFPLLRQEGIRFAAFSPLGGGFLNGNFTLQKVTGERFVDHAAKKIYRGFYDRPEFHVAFEKLQALSEKSGLGTDELSLRWLRHHSQLRDDDVIILGASKVLQIESSMQILQKGPLDEDVAKALGALWTKDLHAGGMENFDISQWKL